ncbi:MAG: hypothetical protein O2960_28480 [Verrucomicrobia bacterium]|nr:hypothetical protein [Verrucomicrobiota bacterium]
MALWQFKIWFVPSDFVGVRDSLTEQECEEQAWTGALKVPIGFQERLSTIRPNIKSWHEQLLQWGKQDGDLIEVWLKGETVESVCARIDCRSLDAEFIRQVFDLARDWSARLVHDRYRTVLPDDLEGFIRMIWESPNLKFMEAPTEWLPKLAKEVAEREKNC